MSLGWLRWAEDNSVGGWDNLFDLLVDIVFFLTLNDDFRLRQVSGESSEA